MPLMVWNTVSRMCEARWVNLPRSLQSGICLRDLHDAIRLAWLIVTLGILRVMPIRLLEPESFQERFFR